MESKFQTSFIPKKPLERSATPRRGGRGIGIIGLIALVIFLLSLAGWGGVFIWQGVVKNAIARDQDSLKNSQKEFELGTVNTLTRLNNRLTASEMLLTNHLGMSKLFDELEQMTLKNVRFNDMSLIYAGGTRGLTLTLKGQALNYAAVAKQSDFFNLNRDFSNTIFSNLDLDASGKVIFSISTDLDPRNFVYNEGSNQNASSTPAATANTNSPFNSPNPSNAPNSSNPSR